jgi:hypothetical protein
MCLVNLHTNNPEIFVFSTAESRPFGFNVSSDFAIVTFYGTDEECITVRMESAPTAPGECSTRGRHW